MRITPSIALAVALSVIGISCDSQQTEVAPVDLPGSSTPEPTQPPSETANESAVPQSTPGEISGPRLAPPGELYVIKDFTVTTDYGVHGFRKGRKVTLVREDGLQMVVTDGEIEASADRDYFTNDLDVAEELAREQAVLQHTARKAADEARRIEAANQAALHEQRAANVKNRRIEDLREQIRAAHARIQTLQAEIEALRPTYGSYSPSVGWSMRSSWYSSPNKQRFEQQIESLRRSISVLESDLLQASSQP